MREQLPVHRERPVRRKSAARDEVPEVDAVRAGPPGRADAVAALQRAAGNGAVAAVLRSATEPVVQRAHWEWDGTKWVGVGSPSTPMPAYKGKARGQKAGEEADAPVVESASYDASETLGDGTEIDWPALERVMAGVTTGTDVAPGVWRKMRQDLSSAISLPNKSHPAHGSNFNKKQRPEVQIKDWAAPLQGELRSKLFNYFKDKHKVEID